MVALMSTAAEADMTSPASGTTAMSARIFQVLKGLVDTCSVSMQRSLKQALFNYCGLMLCPFFNRAS
jgi:hypothetical protein